MMNLRRCFWSSVAAGVLLASAVRSDAGPMAYAVKGVGGTELVQMDLGTGAYTSIGTFTNPGIESLALSPGGALFGGGIVSVYTVSTSTAATTLLGTPLAQLIDMDFDGSTLLASNTGVIYDINTTTGAETIIGAAPTNFYGFAVTSSTTAYVTFRDINNSQAMTLGILNYIAGTITPVGALGSALADGNVLGGLDVASDGNLYGLGVGGEVLLINTSTGLATLIAQTDGNWRALAAIPDAGVPEPATFALSGLGLALAVLLRKR